MATADDPVIGVHVLSEFVYCPRAGLVALESRTDDLGEDLLPPRLDYVPRYDVRRMRREINRQFRRFWFELAALVVVGVLTWFFWNAGYLLGLLGILFEIQLLKSLRRCWRTISELGDQLRIAETAIPRTPDPDSSELQPVNWWELLRAGFISRRYDSDLRDDEWKLAGRPWRVLAQGAARIPVFRRNAADGGVHKQHFVRMAAYCHLIERCTGMESPYAIVLFGDTYDGVTIPNSPENRNTFQDELRAARQIVRNARLLRQEPPPPEPGRCTDCPIGFPVQLQWGQKKRDAFLLRGRRMRKYHSACGDRFRWAAPHRLVGELRLRPPK